MVLDRARNQACRVRVIAAATRGREGERITEVGELAGLGIAGVSDDGAVVASARVARGLLAYLAPLGLPLMEHAEDPALSAGSVMRAGETATRLGLAGWPASAELSIVERDIALADETGGWVHITHLSTASGLDAIRRAKARGVRVTCDVTPHHLALTDDWVAGDRRLAWENDPRVPQQARGSNSSRMPSSGTPFDANTKMNPPLRTLRDVRALWAGLADGTVDAIATDHAPHASVRKEVEFDQAAFGISGLETALPLVLGGVRAGWCERDAVLRALTDGPARVLGLAPSDDDWVAIDEDAAWTVSAGDLLTLGKNTPLLGRELRGRVVAAAVGGTVRYEAGAVAVG
jgi:dihydroorotase